MRPLSRLAAVAAALALCGCAADDAATPAPPETTTAPSAPSPAADAPAPLPVARTEVAGAAWNGRIVVAGGLTAEGGVSDRVDLYDPATNAWTEGPRLPTGLHHTALGVLADRLHVVGGYTSRTDGTWVAQAGVHSLGAGESTWRTEPSLGGPRGGLGVAVARGRLVAVGGSDEKGTIFDRVEVLTAGASRWSPGPSLVSPRDHLAVTGDGDRVLAIAGRRGGFETNLRSTESWDPDERRWVVGPELVDSHGGTSAATPGRPCVTGGEQTAGTIASVECLRDGRWTRVATLATPRHGLAVVALGSTLHVIAGGPQPGLTTSPAHEAIPV